MRESLSCTKDGIYSIGIPHTQETENYLTQCQMHFHSRMRSKVPLTLSEKNSKGVEEEDGGEYIHT